MPSLRPRPRALLDAERALDAATTYAAWRSAAEEHDLHTGAAAWRREDDSPFYDGGLLRADLADLRALRASGDGLGLIRALTASVYRHQADVGARELYEVALAGTKVVVEAWFDEVERCLRWLAEAPVAGIAPDEKLRRFDQAYRVYGRSALLLSGGATWGFHHLGVVKALFENACLPHILSGASTGAMIAAGVCTRTDAELGQMLSDPSEIRLDGLLPVGWRRAREAGGWLDPERLLDVLHHNVGTWTFAEAYARSGRSLIISVSPTRTRQKPRVLSHLGAPEVLVASAALASSALPGLFPPVVLEARGPDGAVVPYLPNERWVDGSLFGDLPKLRLARLHNVNHFIVSQTNPHVVPFRRLESHDAVGAVAGVAVAAARTQGVYAADVARRIAPAWSGPVQRLADRAYALASQEYGGDVDIHPRFRPELLGKMVVNPSRADLAAFILEGQRATWPKLGLVRAQTRIGRVFRECVTALGGAPQ